MKKLFSLLAMAAMVFTACQNDEGVKNPTLADEGIVNLSVGVPELATRALDGDNQSGADSAYGAIDYANYTKFLESDYDVRFQLAVYEAGAAEDAEPVYTEVKYVDFASTANFNDLRFVPGREYQFVFFADFVPQGTQEDFRYNTADLRNITAFEPLNAMDETYDAYFFNKTIKVEAGKVNELEAVLKRPFGKIRVLTTDLAWVEDYAAPAEGEVTFYNHAIYKSFNAVTGEVATEATNAEETIEFDIDPAYYGATMYEGNEALTLFATYLFATDAQEALNFRLDTKEADGSLIKSLDFNTEIPYQRNHLTTLVGNLLTNEADVFVRIDDNFDAEEFVTGDFDNVENNDLGYVRQGELVSGQIYEYETNLFTFQLLSETDGTELREGKYEYTEEVAYLQNATGFRINKGIDVEKGTLTIEKRNTRAEGDRYYVVFDIYATINGKTENYILPWTGELKGAREPLAEPVVTYEVNEVDALYITFSWEAVEGAKNYTVEWNGEKQTVEGTSATFDFSGEDTYATAYVTANPEFTWSYEAATGSVTVDWKKPIVYSEVPVFLQYIKDTEKGTEVAFYTNGLTIYFEKYPSFEGAWYQTAGEIPAPFSKEATVEETVGSAAQVVITEPAIATKFIYTGAMNPYILTVAEVNWVAGYNTVKVKFSNEAGDAIEFQTTAPMEAGHATIEPTYVAIGGDQAGDIENAEMNVLLEKGEYTIFFTIHSAINDVLMQYVGAIDFEKPYAPEYVLTSYEARENTIYFKGDGVEYEIEATSLESGDVVVKYIAIQDSPMEITAATAVVKEKENGDYDARYTLPLGYTNPFTGKDTFDLQYVGPFKAYEATPEPEEAKKFTATWVVEKGSYIFTGVEYNFTIIINNLATTTYYTGDSTDAWAYDWTLGQSMNNFRTGDFLTVENNVVTLEFTAAPVSEEYRYKMVVDMNEEPAEPENIYLSATVDGTVYTAVEDDYMIDYTDGYANAYYQGKLMGGVTVDVADGADDIEFTFFHKERNAYIHIIYNKATVTPATDVEVQLTLEGEVYMGQYETTIYSLTGLDYGKAMLQIDYADGTSAKGLNADYTEDDQFITFTFADEKNNVNVSAYYQKTNGPAEPEVDPSVIKLTSMSEGEYNGSYYFYQYTFTDGANSTFTLAFSDYIATATTLTANTYSFQSQISYVGGYTDQFALNSGKTYLFNGEKSKINNGNVVVAANGDQYTIDMNFSLINGNEVKYQYVGKIGGTVTPEPDQPGTDEPEEPAYEELNLTATYETLTGSIKAYHAEPYWINGDTWTEGNPATGNAKQEGKLESTETNGNVTTFKFTDEVNKKKVTVTYTEEPTQPDYSNWVTAVRTDGSNMTFTGATGTITGKLGKFALSTTTFTEVKLNDTAVNAEGTVTIALGNGDYIATLNIVIDGVTYGGSAHFNY